MIKRMFRRRKDGSLNLSIQAIVVLVMAMALLGLGLGFIRGLLGKSQAQFETAIDNAQLENPATSSNPITVDRTVKIKSDDTAKMRIGFYNAGSPDSFTPELDSDCEGAGFDLESGAQAVPTGEARGYEALIIADNTVDAGSSHVCTIKFGSQASKQFFIDVIA